MNIVEKLTNYFKAGYPCLAVISTEEKRVQRDIVSASLAIKRNVIVWSASEGLMHVKNNQQVPDTEDLLAAMRNIQSSQNEDTIYIMRDVHQWAFDRDPIMARYLRDIITDAPARGCCIVIIAPEFAPFSTIENLVTMIEYDLPSEEDLMDIAKSILDQVKKSFDVVPEVIKALSGLSTTEAENALALSLIESGNFIPEIIYREKVAAVKRTGRLQIVDPDPRGLDAIGGLENLKAWILKRKDSYSKDAADYGIKTPKGVLLVGVPGTGKSLSAKAIGTALGVPTLRLDIGSLFNSLVGESELRTREALRLADAMAPCVLFVDECDKGLAGSQGSGSNDGGTARKVFGTLLQWMQDKTKPVFCVMTANQVEFLPPEFLRRGRFDELFTVDLPHEKEREQIAAVVLKKLKRDPAKFDLTAIAAATNTYTGVEIESAIEDSLYLGYADNRREITTDDIVKSAKEVTPISKIMPEKIDAIRRWGEGSAKPASSNSKSSTVSTSTRKIQVDMSNDKIN